MKKRLVSAYRFSTNFLAEALVTLFAIVFGGIFFTIYAAAELLGKLMEFYPITVPICLSAVLTWIFWPLSQWGVLGIMAIFTILLGLLVELDERTGSSRYYY